MTLSRHNSFVTSTVLFFRCLFWTRLMETTALCQSLPSQAPPTPLRGKCEYLWKKTHFVLEAQTHSSKENWHCMRLISDTRTVSKSGAPSMTPWLNWPPSVLYVTTPPWTSMRSEFPHLRFSHIRIIRYSLWCSCITAPTLVRLWSQQQQMEAVLNLLQFEHQVNNWIAQL